VSFTCDLLGIPWSSEEQDHVLDHVISLDPIYNAEIREYRDVLMPLAQYVRIAHAIPGNSVRALRETI